MGAWGYKGYDNDSGCDWLGGLADMLKFTLDHAFCSRWTEEGIAAAQLLTELPWTLQLRLGVYVFNEALEIVESELEPEKLKPWKSPTARRHYLSVLHRKLSMKQRTLALEEKRLKARMKKMVAVRARKK